MPDIIEPAINPNHRSLFHSLLIGAIAIFAGKKIWDYVKTTGGNSKDAAMAMAAFAFIAGYGSHLGTDALTPKSLPVIGI